jgi:hypothetical protein
MTPKKPRRKSLIPPAVRPLVPSDRKTHQGIAPTSRGKGAGPSMITEHEPVTSPDQNLWRMVIVQALIDATANPGTANKYRRRDIAEAREWLLRPSADFDTVCNLAGFDPLVIRDAVLDFLDDGKRLTGFGVVSPAEKA